MGAEAVRPAAGLPMPARVAIFLGVVVFFVWFTNIEPGRRAIAAPITHASVLSTAALINAVGGEVRADDTWLIGPTAHLDVKDGCNGVIAMILFLGAVVAHAAPRRDKILGLVIGIPLIFVVNLIRLVTLYGVAVVAPERLEFFHVFFWQTLIIIFVAVLWYFWADWSLAREMRRRPARPPAGEGVPTT